MDESKPTRQDSSDSESEQEGALASRPEPTNVSSALLRALVHDRAFDPHHAYTRTQSESQSETDSQLAKSRVWAHELVKQIWMRKYKTINVNEFEEEDEVIYDYGKSF